MTCIYSEIGGAAALTAVVEDFITRACWATPGLPATSATAT